MPQYDFETFIDRSGSGSLKESGKPEVLSRNGLPSYWGAEFDFPTCPAFSRGVMECAERGLYAFTLQTDAYNERVAWWMRNVRDWQIGTDWIVPTHGTIFALASAIRLLVGKDEQMIVLTPGYNRYKQAADRMGKRTLLCPMAYDAAGNRYSVDFDALERCMADPSSALLVLCNPNNPTGLTLTGPELQRIDALSRRYQIPVFSDEIFGEISLTGEVITPYGRAAGPDSLSITCTSLGKCMSLTGVNHANVIIPDPELRKKYIRQKYADHYGSIDPMMYAGLMRAYTPEGKDWLTHLLETVRGNRRCFAEGVEKAFSGARAVPAGGTYVVWVDYTGTGLGEDALADRLKQGMLYGDPGSEYYSSDLFYRYSIALPPAMLKKSMDHLLQTLH